MYDNILGPNSKTEKSVSQPKAGLPKTKSGSKTNGQRKPTAASTQDIAPPLPERNSYLNEDDDDDDDEQIYAKPKKEANGNSYSSSTNKDIHYSHVKETQINQKNMMKANPQSVLYSEVKLDHSLPSALGHLQGSSQSLSMDSRKPRLISSLNGLSECEVLEMRFATSIQTVNSKTLSGQFLHARDESPGGSFLFPNALSNSEGEDTYAQIPFRDPHCTNEYHTVDKISNYSMCTTNTYDHVSTRTSKEVASREINKKVTHASTAQDNPYETVSKDFTKLAVKKQNVAKVEKPKKFFFGDKKK